MGIPGAGKSRLAEEYVARGYLRLNRDERGGSLASLADALDEELAAGARSVVLDNTYLTRAARSHVIEAAGRHGVPTRCVWLDTPLAQAQVNLVERLLDAFGDAAGARGAARRSRGASPAMLAPTSQMRALRELEPPSADEGFARVERVPFVRRAARRRADAGSCSSPPPRSPRPGWERRARRRRPGGAAPRLRLEPGRDAPDALASGRARRRRRGAARVEARSARTPAARRAAGAGRRCPGCRSRSRARTDVDPARSVLIGTGPAHRTLAGALGARYVAV